MYLKSLDMLGFKSFAEAKIQFPEGITAIVGPNGSGKSNVVDAILWVLGEQSTKTLRSERMEDVIFNGTEVRKPLGMVEVSLVIGGLGNIKAPEGSGLPGSLRDYQELMITRRLYRNGESEYLLNKTLCRLKDIRGLLLDTRAGTKGHTVIEQGRLDQILNASPQDRRELIEETAGIVRYKKQKAEALRKLESTQLNLSRVRDIIAEVKKQLTSLDRQARQARNYHTLQQEARTLEIQLLSQEYRALRQALVEIDTDATALSRQESDRLTEQARVEADLETRRLKMTAIGQAIEQVRGELQQAEQRQSHALTAMEVERHKVDLYGQQKAQASQEHARLAQECIQARGEMDDLRRALEELDAEILKHDEALAELDRAVHSMSAQRAASVSEEERGRQDLLGLAVLVSNTEQQLTQLQARQDESAVRLASVVAEREAIDHQLGTLKERQRRTADERQEVGSRIVEFEQRQQDLHGALAERLARGDNLDREIGRRAEELAALESRLRALEGVVREEMGYGREGDEERTALRTCEGVQRALAEWLVVPEGLDRALEALLGERLRGWLVDKPDDGRRAIEFLTEKGLGRGTFIPGQIRWHPQGEVGSSHESWWPPIAQEPGVVGRAVDLVQTTGEAPGLKACLLDSVVVVQSLDAALRLWEQQGWGPSHGPTLVTVAGEVLDPTGVMTGGATHAGGGLLQRRREVMDLSARRTELIQAMEEKKAEREAMTAQVAQVQEESQRADATLRETEMLDLCLQKDHALLEQQIAETMKRLEIVTDEVEDGRRVQARLEQERGSCRAQLDQWMAEKASQEALNRDRRARLEHLEQELSLRRQQLTEARLSLDASRARRMQGDADVARREQWRDETVGRIQTLEGQLAGLSDSIEASTAERTRQEALCLELGQETDRIKRELVSAQESLAAEMQVARNLENDATDMRQVLSDLRERRMAVEVRKAEVKTQFATLESTLSGTYEMSPEAVLASVEGPRGETESDPEASRQTPSDEEAREQLRKIRERLDRMGPINLAAIEEHRELDERYRFLTTQEQDLANSIASLREIIQRINRTTREMFGQTFEELQGKFREVFSQFFPGGRAELVLVEDQPGEGAEPGTSREPGIEIVAQPPGKRLKSITMLSGGEKTLTAMALLFASFLIRPTPFCILDEIDAPLDEENIGRFTTVLRQLAAGAQFLVITHNKRTMEMADSLFGVTMEEPGVSKLISVRLADLQPA